nr:transmembrane protein [Tanacetum cinerariifolium]
MLFLFLLLGLFFLNGITATRQKAMLSHSVEKGAAFFPPTMPVPPSGPSKQHNSVSQRSFIPAIEAPMLVFGFPDRTNTLSKTAPEQNYAACWALMVELAFLGGRKRPPFSAEWGSIAFCRVAVMPFRKKRPRRRKRKSSILQILDITGKEVELGLDPGAVYLNRICRRIFSYLLTRIEMGLGEGKWVPFIFHIPLTRAEGNTNGNNGNQIRCYNCKGLGHLARIQLQAKEFDLMGDVADLDEIEEVNANYILVANLQTIHRTALHCFYVHNDGYFAHVPLSYINGVILNMNVLRIAYKPFTEFLEEKCGNYFQGLYYQVPDVELERGLVRVSNDRELSYMFDVEETFGRLELYLDHLDEMVDWAEMEVEKQGRSSQHLQKIDKGKEKVSQDETKGVEARTSTIDKGKEKVRPDETMGVEARTSTIDKGKEKVRQDETIGVEARTSILNSDYDSDDDSEYDSDKSVDYLSLGEEELIELRNRMKANREEKSKAKAFGKHLEEKHVTWARFEEKMDTNATIQASDFHFVAFTKSA